MQLDNASSTSMLPGNVVNLLLIDSRITANELIVQAMNDNTQCIIFDYSVDTIETLKAKISEHPVQEFSSVGIVQHNYSTPTYQLLHSMQSSVLENAEAMDASLESWSELKDFVAFLKDSKKTQNYDLLACNIYSDPNWKYVLTLLDSHCAIHFRASSDATGWGGNWILESDNVDLTHLYFTDKIADYPFTFSSFDTAHVGILINGKPYTCGYNNFGQLGHGTADTSVATLTEMVRPTDISSNATYVAVQIAIGVDYTCVLYSNGSDYKLYSCGCNAAGKLGQGISASQNDVNKTHTRLSPVSLSALGGSYTTGLVNITISITNMWFLLVLNYATDFKTYACGWNYYNGLGTGTANLSSLTLVPRTNIPTGTYVKCCTAGGISSVLLMSNNKVYSTGLTTGTSVLTEWSGLNIAGKTIKTIALGNMHYLVLYTDNTIYAKGYSYFGQCGVLLSNDAPLTKLVPTTPIPSGYTPTSIACGDLMNVVMYSNGTTNIPYTNGQNISGQLGRNPECVGAATAALSGKANLDPMVLTGITLSPSIVLAYGNKTIVVFKGADNNVNKVYMCGRNVGDFGNGLFPTTSSSVLNESTTINSLLTTCTLSPAPLVTPNNYDMAFATAAVAVILTPDAPTGLSAAAGNGQITITFTAGAANDSPITNYQYSTDGSSNWTAINPTTATITSPAVITGLTNGQSYTYYLRAINANGNGAKSLTSVTATPRTTPDAPTGLSAEEGNGQATITFTAGAANGSAITNYQYSTDGSTNWIAVSSITSAVQVVITGLTYQTYSIYLRAVNAAGNGAASLTSVTTTPYLVPDAPIVNSVVLGDRSATINFTAGASNGRAITNYQYTCSSTGTDNWVTIDPASTTSPIIVSNLTNGTTYSVKLKAISSAGSSVASAAQSVTPATAPAAPTITSITAGNLKATINITANATNGSAITNYKYTCSSTGVDNWITISPASASTTIVVTGLSNETLYSVKVIAVNGVGDSPASSASSVTPSISAPDAPTINSITSGNGTASIDFTSNSDNGLSITNYKYSTDGGSKWTMRDPISTATPLLLSNLVNGTACSIQIKAINEKGSSVASNAISATSASTPDAPTITSITAGNGSASVAFIANETNGSAITGYQYSIDSAAWVAVATTNPIALSGLTNNQTYSIRILAVNVKGDGSASTAMSVTPAAAPAAPSVSSVTAGNDALSIDFSSGASNGSAIKNYKYSTDNGTSWTMRTPASVASPLSVTSKISNGSSYNVILKAINDKGVSSVSNTQAVTAAVVPAAPTITSIKSGDQSASIYYIAGAANGSAITTYRYSTDNGTSWTSSTANPILVSSLTNNQAYSVRLIAVNGKGNSLPSDAVQVTPAKAPAAPTITSVIGSGSSITINFNEGATNGSPIINYKYSTNGGVIWTLRTPVSAESPIVVSRLTTGTTYSVQIKAINAKGVSVASDAVSVTL